MELDLIAAPFEHDTLEIVVKNDPWLTAPSRETMHVTAQKVLHGLIEKEL